MRSLKLKSDRLQGQGSQAECVGEGLKNSLLWVLRSPGQGDTMPTRTERWTTLFCPKNEYMLYDVTWLLITIIELQLLEVGIKLNKVNTINLVSYNVCHCKTDRIQI